MNAHEFYRDVAERAMLSKGEAADLTRAVLEALAMRVSAGEVRHLIRQSPKSLQTQCGGTAKVRGDSTWMT